MGYPWGAALTNAWTSLIVVLAVMLAAIGMAYARKRHDGIDSVWGIGFAVVAAYSLILSAGDGPVWRRVLLFALTAAWGLRLGVYIAIRNHGKPEDKRYVELMKEAKGNPWLHAFRKVYLTQGAVMWFVSLPVQFGMYGYGGAWWPVVLGAVVWAVGLFFESVGDYQLARFTAEESNKGKVMDRGLWHYTRHPNYFGDACVWTGLYLVACHHWAGAATILSPVLMVFLLTRGTGKALLEKSIGNRRKGYAEYVTRTSGFFPLPPKKDVPSPQEVS